MYSRHMTAGGQAIGRSEDGAGAPLRTVVLPRLPARSLSERAYLLIRDRIVTLALQPGSVIEENALRQELGLGRTPIREALQRLASERLVSSVPHRGWFVTDVNITDLGRVTELRVELEGYAAHLAAQRATPVQLAAMRDLAQDLGELADTGHELLMNLDQRIHRLVWSASGNRYLEDACEVQFTHSLRHWFLVIHLVQLRAAVAEHRSVLEAIVARDPARAEETMRRHVTGFEREVRRVL
jgi:DNA-binding GntR family transcriptional regulator